MRCGNDTIYCNIDHFADVDSLRISIEWFSSTLSKTLVSDREHSADVDRSNDVPSEVLEDVLKSPIWFDSFPEDLHKNIESEMFMNIPDHTQDYLE